MELKKLIGKKMTINDYLVEMKKLDKNINKTKQAKDIIEKGKTFLEYEEKNIELFFTCYFVHKVKPDFLTYVILDEVNIIGE